MSETPPDQPQPDPVELTPEEIDAAEAAAYPDRADPEHWDAVVSFLQSEIESEGKDETFENMLECLRLNLKGLVAKAPMVNRHRRRRLRLLRAERQRQDDDRQALDDEITDLET